MAPQKRSAPVDSDDDLDPDNHADAVPSSSQSSGRKRPRTSGDSSIAPRSGAGESDTDPSTPPSDADITVDGDSGDDHGDDHGDDDDDQEDAATQAIRARHDAQRDKGNEAAEFGILEAVELRNFMCHEDMQYKLGPLINFICGKNGSGKSAILTAIVLCLGGKASATNRGARLQDFIKEGKDHASIVCKLKNQGDNAYMPDDYGKTIVVERHFSRNGASSFKLKSDKGRIISTRKMDLEEICDHFTLQIDNPMNVLSQDQARQFIASASTSEKYKLFMKGVQLEQLDQDYKLIQENWELMKVKIDLKAPDIKDLKTAADRANDKLVLAEAHNSMLDRMRDLRRKYTWAQVAQQEAIRDEYTQEISNMDAKIAELEATAATFDATYEEAAAVWARESETFNQAMGKLAQLEEEKAEAAETQKQAKKDANEAVNEQRKVREALTEASNIIDRREKEIAEEEERLAEISGGGAAKRVVELRNAKEALDEAVAAEAQHANIRSEITTEIDLARTLKEKAEADRKAKQSQVAEQRRILDQLKNGQHSENLAYGQQGANLPNLLKAIQQEQRFENAPIGPLGKHVKLLKPEWSSILEKYFGSALNSFIVTSKRDQTLLSEIMRRTKCSLPIILGNNLPIDTTSHEPDERFLTVMKVLEIDNEAVRKQLVILNGIEQTVLIEDLMTASNILFADAGPVRNVKRCFCFHSKSRNYGFLLQYRNGKRAQDPAHGWNGPPRMQTDRADRLRRQQESFDEVNQELHELEKDFRRLRDREVRAEQALVRHEREAHNLKIATQKAEDEVERLENAISEDRVEGGKLEALRTALEEAVETRETHASSFQSSVRHLDGVRKALKACTETLQGLDEQIETAKAETRELQRVAQEADKARCHALGEKNNFRARIQDCAEDRNTAEERRAGMEEKVADYTAQAREISERVNLEAGETPELIHKKLEKMTAEYKRYMDRIGPNREQIAEDAARTAAAYRKAQETMQEMEDLRDQLHKTLTERQVRWKRFRAFISGRAKAQFTYMLSERSFRGKLITDHKQKLLDIQVEPDITKRDGSGRTARTLSGGEKSFSQICLLLAIWEAMGSPIRCLDEFDVFMDAVNRKISINLLIEGARQSIGKQFILISPGTKNDIKRGSDVTAIEIAPPERGQTRLVLAAA